MVDAHAAVVARDAARDDARARPARGGGSPKYLAPTRRSRARACSAARRREGCRDATLPSGETATTTSREAKGDRGAFVAVLPERGAQPHVRGGVLRVRGGAGGDAGGVAPEKRRRRKSVKVPLPARELKQRLKDGDIEQRHDWSTPRAWLGGPPPNKDGPGTGPKDAKGWLLPKTMATKGQSFGGAMLERDGRRQPGPPR